MNKRLIIWGIVLLNFLFSTLILSGCSNRPYLTGNNSYIIHRIKPNAESINIPIVIPWNFNMAILNKLLLESSFVLSELQTPDSNISEKTTFDTVLLESVFPKSQEMNLEIDKHPITMNINSIQIEVGGSHNGRVILNKTIIYQGIDDPNLQPAFDNFVKSLNLKNQIISHTIEI